MVSLNSKHRATFLKCLYYPAKVGWLELAYIHPTKTYQSRVFEYVPLPFSQADMNTLAAQVEKCNRAGYNVYFGCTVRREKKDHYHRGTKADALTAPFLWCDIDEHTPDVPKRLLALENPPVMIVDSGGGYHGYWLLDTPFEITTQSTPRIERVLKGIALAVNGDTKVAETARIMRMPETANTKPERNNALCRVIHCEPKRHSFNALEVMYAPFAPVPQQINRRVDLLPSTDTRLPKWIQEYLEHGVNDHRNNRLYVVSRWYHDNNRSQSEAERELGARARLDGLDDTEIERTIASAFNAPKGCGDLATHVRRDISTRDQIIRTMQLKGQSK